MQAGETEFLDVKDATGTVTDQYQLDLIKIHTGKTASAAKAKASSPRRPAAHRAGPRVAQRVPGRLPLGRRERHPAGRAARPRSSPRRLGAGLG